MKEKVNKESANGLLNFLNPNKPQCENKFFTPGQSNQIVKTLFNKKTKVVANIE